MPNSKFSFNVRWHKTNQKWVFTGNKDRQWFPTKIMAMKYALMVIQELYRETEKKSRLTVYTKTGDVELEREYPK